MNSNAWVSTKECVGPNFGLMICRECVYYGLRGGRLEIWFGDPSLVLWVAVGGIAMERLTRQHEMGSQCYHHFLGDEPDWVSTLRNEIGSSNCSFFVGESSTSRVKQTVTFFLRIQVESRNASEQVLGYSVVRSLKQSQWKPQALIPRVVALKNLFIAGTHELKRSNAPYCCKFRRSPLFITCIIDCGDIEKFAVRVRA